MLELRRWTRSLFSCPRCSLLHAEEEESAAALPKHWGWKEQKPARIRLEGKRRTGPRAESLKGQILKDGRGTRQEASGVREAEVSLRLTCGCWNQALLNLTIAPRAGALNLHHAHHSISYLAEACAWKWNVLSLLITDTIWRPYLMQWKLGAGWGREAGGRRPGKACGSSYRQLGVHSLPAEKSAVTETVELPSVWLSLFFIRYPGYAKQPHQNNRQQSLTATYRFWFHSRSFPWYSCKYRICIYIQKAL